MSAERQGHARTRPHRWGMVVFQSATIAGLIAGSLLLAASAHGAAATIGRTWPVAEPDALLEIEARIARQPASLAARFGPRSNWSALKAAALARARENRSRSVVPYYRLEADLRLPDGTVLYPRGYTFNPLAYVSLPQRLVIVHPRDLAWALETARLSDWILLAAGEARGAGGAEGDPLVLGEKVGRPLFVLEERVKQRLGLTVAPVIVRQVGQRLELSEIRLGGPPQGRKP